MADIIDLIQQDHDEVRALFAELESAAADRRGEVFRCIVAELVRHQAAEQIIVHPALRHDAVRSRAPTRPHPLAPNEPGIQATLGPVVGIFDRARDSVRETLWHKEAR